MASVSAIVPGLQAAPLEPRRPPEDADRPGAPDETPAPAERVSLSPEARARASAADRAGAGGERAVNGKRLDAGQEAEVQRLRETDAHVRAHERAHQAAGGAAAGAASFQYVLGPDGKVYAVAGEVPIRLESGRTPDETIAAARRMRAAALAPMDPSPQDLAVAAEAVRLEASARERKASEGGAAAGRPPGTRREVDAYRRSGAAVAGSLVAVRA